MYQLQDYHSKFVKRALEASQLLPTIYSAVPTFIFLLSSFAFLYMHIHRSTGVHTRWKYRLIKDIKFHWIYFNTTRLWFIFISCLKRLLAVAQEYIDMHLEEKDKYFNRVITDSSAFMIVMTLSLVPVVMIYVNHWTHVDMPNFLMWVMEDPYVRHEIGMSGHCLERPLRVNLKKLKNYPYRSKKSTSFDTNPWISQKPPAICRNCKSMIEHNVVNSIEELLD